MYQPVEAMSHELKKSYSDARANVVLASPLTSYLLFKCAINFTDDKVGQFNTAAAVMSGDEISVWINVEFWNKRLTNSKQRAFILVHEVRHIFLQHLERMLSKGYKPNKWNRATDYFINLGAAGFSKNGVDEKYQKYLELPDFVLFDRQYIGMSSDEIYDLLPDDGADSFDSVGEGSPSGKISNEIEKSLREAQVAGNMMGKQIGKGDADFLRYIDDILYRPIPWHQLLETEVERSYDDTITYNRISRRSEDDIIFPTKEGEFIHLLFGVDTSGSMSSHDLAEATGVLYNFLQNYEAWRLTYVTCDVKAHVIGEFYSDDGDDFTTTQIQAKKKAKGGGGTNLQGIVDYASQLHDNDEAPDSVVIITDGYIPPVKKKLDVPHIFIVTTGGNMQLTSKDCTVLHM